MYISIIIMNAIDKFYLYFTFLGFILIFCDVRFTATSKVPNNYENETYLISTSENVNNFSKNVSNIMLELNNVSGRSQLSSIHANVPLSSSSSSSVPSGERGERMTDGSSPSSSSSQFISNLGINGQEYQVLELAQALQLAFKDIRNNELGVTDIQVSFGFFCSKSSDE